MQKELETIYPALDIELIGVNKVGKAAGNEEATQGRDIPLLQDVDAEGDGDSDVWSLWNVEWRDVVIVDGNNAQVDTYNLTSYNLAEAENYATLREMLVDGAMQSQKPWQNSQDELDTDNNTDVTLLDALTILNELNSAGSYELPPPTTNSTPPPYYDCNGDGYVTPLDALLVINYLNDRSSPAVGEGETPAIPADLLVDALESSEILKPILPSSDLLPAVRGLAAYQPSIQDRVSGETYQTAQLTSTSKGTHQFLGHGGADHKISQPYLLLSRDSSYLIKSR